MAKKANKTSTEPATEGQNPSVPVLAGTELHYQGKVYDLTRYYGQQFRQVGGRTIYEFLLSGGGKETFVVSGVAEAHTLEAACNKFFRGW